MKLNASILFFIFASLSEYAMGMIEQVLRINKRWIKPTAVNSVNPKKSRIKFSTQKSIIDALPLDLRIKILKSFNSKTLMQMAKDLECFYTAAPQTANSDEANKTIFRYLCGEFDIDNVISYLNAFPLFESPQMTQWITQEKKRTDNEKELIKAAIIHNGIKKVRELLAQGVNIDAQSPSSKHTALIGASFHNATDVALELIHSGANVNAQDYPDEATPLIYATHASNLNLVIALLENGADPNQRIKPSLHTIFAGMSSLLIAAYKLEDMQTCCYEFSVIKDIIEALLKKHANPRIKDKHGKTAQDHITENFLLSNKQKADLKTLFQQYDSQKQ